MYRIISVSQKTRMRITRDEILAAAGFTVISPRTPFEAPLLVSQAPVDAVVLGHSVEPEDRKKIIPAIRKACDCPIIFVYLSPESGVEPLADVCVDVTNGSEALLRALQNRLRGDKIA